MANTVPNLWSGGSEWGTNETPEGEAYWGPAVVYMPSRLSPSSYWRLGETASPFLDTMGTSIKFSGAGTYYTYQAGPFTPADDDYALNFDGSTGYATAGDFYTFSGTASHSGSVWVRPFTFPANARILSKEQTSTGWLLRTSATGVVAMERRNGAGTDTAQTAAGTLTSLVWTHVGWTYDGSNIRLYINGALATTQASTRSQSTNTQSLTMARRSDSAASYFHGTLDELAIWDGTVLTAADMAAIYGAKAEAAAMMARRPRPFVAVKGKSITSAVTSASWRNGRQGWFDVLGPNSASVSLVGTADVGPNDDVVLSHAFRALWVGRVDGITTDTALDGLITQTISATDVVGTMGVAQLNAYTVAAGTLIEQTGALASAAGIPITITAAPSNTSLPTLLSTSHTGSLLEYVNLAEKSSNAVLMLMADGTFRALVRDASSSSSVTTLQLVGVNAPSSWSEQLGRTGILNAFLLVKSDGTVVQDVVNETSVGIYGENTYSVSDYLSNSSAHFPVNLRATVAYPRDTMPRGEFPIYSYSQDVLDVQPLDWVARSGSTWQVLQVEHSVDGSDWRMTIAADQTQNALVASSDPTPDDPTDPSVSTSSQTLTSTKSAALYYDGGYKGNGAGSNLPVGVSGYYGQYRYRSLIGFTITWPAAAISVKSATLRLKTTTQDWITFGSSPKVYVQRITGSWSEGTYNAAPPNQWSTTNAVTYPGPTVTTTGQVLAAITTATSTLVDIDITDIANDWLSSGITDASVRLIAASESVSTYNTEFLSDDGATPPQLIIVTYVTA